MTAVRYRTQERNRADALDRLVELPSAEPSDHVMMRSPCTSLYGSCRPTTGTDSIQQSTRQPKAAQKRKQQAERLAEAEAMPKTRGRPSAEIKSAVKEELRNVLLDRNISTFTMVPVKRADRKSVV